MTNYPYRKKNEQKQGTASNDWFDKLFKFWWGKLFLGVVMLAVGIFEFSRLSSLENGERESVRVTMVEKTLYDIGGKWLATGLFVFPGAMVVLWGIKQAATGTSEE